MELLLKIALFLMVAWLIMIAASILYALFTVAVPVIAAAVIVFGIGFGLGVAVKNTCGAYRKVYWHKGGGAR